MVELAVSSLQWRWTSLDGSPLGLIDCGGFQVAPGDFESLPGDSVEALVVAWNDGLNGAISRVVPWCLLPCSVKLPATWFISWVT